ncbi:hypothetical protein [Candidatus Solirubrobacter pratensis]|uniref:hypothetical protein n=1 Tax=Candidatus Solirubrobacter pratensis TaxID=1298857 RepID=UPI000405C267|nr:hypothetical protein [Candidatus Solirubrobacter pratensis]
MPTPQPSDRAVLGRARLAERARRVARIRRAVVAATLAAFVLAWGVIVFDGPMGTTKLAAAGASTSATVSPSSDGTWEQSTSSGSSASSDPPAAVTTGQS